MLGLSPLKLLLIVLAVILLFGANRLPRLASDLGKAIRAFGKSVRGEDDDRPRP